MAAVAAGSHPPSEATDAPATASSATAAAPPLLGGPTGDAAPTAPVPASTSTASPTPPHWLLESLSSEVQARGPQLTPLYLQWLLSQQGMPADVAHMMLARACLRARRPRRAQRHAQEAVALQREACLRAAGCCGEAEVDELVGAYALLGKAHLELMDLDLDLAKQQQQQRGTERRDQEVVKVAGGADSHDGVGRGGMAVCGSSTSSTSSTSSRGSSTSSTSSRGSSESSGSSSSSNSSSTGAVCSPVFLEGEGNKAGAGMVKAHPSCHIDARAHANALAAARAYAEATSLCTAPQREELDAGWRRATSHLDHWEGSQIMALVKARAPPGPGSAGAAVAAAVVPTPTWLQQGSQLQAV